MKSPLSTVPSVHVRSGQNFFVSALNTARFGFHPHLPVRLGYRRLLALSHPKLARLLTITDAYTLVPALQRVMIYREALQVLRDGVSGDFIEIGVHRGGSAGILADLLKSASNRNLHLFDRWGDLPEPTAQDGFRATQYRKDAIRDKLEDLKKRPPLPDARHLINEVIGLPESRTFYHMGWYNQTLPLAKAECVSGIAFASVDCDYYESVKLSLAFISRLASPGCCIVVDDYASWPGAKKAVDELLGCQDVLEGRSVQLRAVSTWQAVLKFRGV